MNLNKIIAIFVIGIFLISFGISFESEKIEFVKGKNTLFLNSSEYFYVKTFVKLNPDVEVVSFFENNQTIGYVNFLDGVGENFIMNGEIEYEVIMGENATIVLP